MIGATRGRRRCAGELVGPRRLAERSGDPLAEVVGGGGHEGDVHADGPDLRLHRGDG